LESVPKYIQQDATLHSFFISVNCSTCFGWIPHPLSGAQNCILKHLVCVKPLLLPATIVEDSSTIVAEINKKKTVTLHFVGYTRTLEHICDARTLEHQIRNYVQSSGRNLHLRTISALFLNRDCPRAEI